MSCCGLAAQSVCLLCPRPRAWGRTQCGQTSADNPPRKLLFYRYSQPLTNTSNAVVLQGDWAAHHFALFAIINTTWALGLALGRRVPFCSGGSIQYVSFDTPDCLLHIIKVDDSSKRDCLTRKVLFREPVRPGNRRSSMCLTVCEHCRRSRKENEIM